MKFIKYCICSALAIGGNSIMGQTNSPADMAGLNAVACSSVGLLESSVVKTLDKTKERLEYLEILDKMFEGYTKIRIEELDSGRLTKERAVQMSDLIVKKYLSSDSSQVKQAKSILSDCLKLGIKNGIFMP